MAADRWVVVDDTDPSIKYTGSWFEDSSGGLDNVGSNGATYQHTLHGTSLATATAEFEFHGTAVRMLGTSTNDTSLIFDCLIDGASIAKEELPPDRENNWILCKKTGLLDTVHVFRVEVRVGSLEQTFWLDQLLYVPSLDVPLNNKTIMVDNTDPAVHFDSHWTNIRADTLTTTTQKDSIAQVNFIGTSITWVAFVPPGDHHEDGTATWQIDDGKPTKFSFSGLSPNSIGSGNQFYFTTPDVEAGPHTLTVTFLGDNNTCPLFLDHMYINNGTLPIPTSVNNSTTPPNQTPRGDNSKHPPSGRDISAIIGGVLGGLGFLVVLGAILFFWRRRKIRQKENPHVGREDPIQHNPMLSINPIHNNSSPILHARKPPLYPTPNTVTSSGLLLSLQAATTNSSSEDNRDSGLHLGAQPALDLPPQYALH